MPMPETISRLLAAADAAWAALPEAYQRGGSAWSRADPMVLYGELRRVRAARPRFLEWGSGLGVITLMADALGLPAAGIEYDARLVSAARRLAAETGAAATFTHGSFILPDVDLPVDDGSFTDDGEEDECFLFAGDASESNGCGAGLAAGGVELEVGPPVNPAGFDLIYAYPAQHHVDWYLDLFTRVAKAGATLWLYTETAGVLAARKTDAEGRPALRPI